MTAAGRHLQALLSAADDPAEALAALLAAGGWEALGETDRRLVARSIDERRRAEPAAPVESDGWYAARTADPAAVADEFGLAVRFPVTLRWGTAALYRDPDSLVFISPVLDGWTLVFDALSPGDRVESLSGRFGQGQYYYRFESFTRWVLAEHGHVVRDYNNENPDARRGDPHPAEAGFRLPHELPGDPRLDRLREVGAALRADLPDVPEDAVRAWYAHVCRAAKLPPQDLPRAALTDPAAFDRLPGLDRLGRGTCTVSTVAARASVDPFALNDRTTVYGSGLLCRRPSA